jgi:hypothetical protein
VKVPVAVAVPVWVGVAVAVPVVVGVALRVGVAVAVWVAVPVVVADLTWGSGRTQTALGSVNVEPAAVSSRKVLTLPSAVAGYRCRVIVSTAPTGGNSHVISATGTTDTFAGTVAIHDLDGATASWFASSSDNTITLNATTKGGALGDSFTLEAISGSVWAITAATLRCATGSNPATPFSTV